MTESYCPLSLASMILSSKWDLIVIHNLLKSPMRFTELKSKVSEGIEGEVTASSLSRILKRLEQQGIVAREVSSDRQIKIQYMLTPMGKDLEPVLRELKTWGSKHFKELLPVENS